MGKKKGFTENDHAEITRMLGSGLSTLEISKKLHWDHCTIKAFVLGGKSCRKTPKWLHLWKLTARDLRKIKYEVSKKPHETSKKIFESAGVPKVGKTTHCEVLKILAKVKSPIKRPPLNKTNKMKRVEWAHSYMKTNVSNVIFTNECHATLDGPDGWSSGWVLNGRPAGVRIRRQQGVGGVMFWAGIRGNELIGPHKVPKGLKLNSNAYCWLLEDAFLP